MTKCDLPWHAADLVALDLEGSGGQDGDQEAILEIAVVPLRAGQPVPPEAYASLVKRWPDHPEAAMDIAGIDQREPARRCTTRRGGARTAARMNGRFVVGHNIGVDWRLLHGQCPTITPAGLNSRSTSARSTVAAALVCIWFECGTDN